MVAHCPAVQLVLGGAVTLAIEMFELPLVSVCECLNLG